MKALNDVQMSTVKSMVVVDIPLYYNDIVQLTNWVKISNNKIKKIELMDCIIQLDSLRKFSTYLIFYLFV